MEIRAYTRNGSGCWEFDGSAWDAETFSTEGDFSAYADGEPIRLVGIRENTFADDDDHIVEERIGVVRSGEFSED